MASSWEIATHCWNGGRGFSEMNSCLWCLGCLARLIAYRRSGPIYSIRWKTSSFANHERHSIQLFNHPFERRLFGQSKHKATQDAAQRLCISTHQATQIDWKTKKEKNNLMHPRVLQVLDKRNEKVRIVPRGRQERELEEKARREIGKQKYNWAGGK